MRRGFFVLALLITTVFSTVSASARDIVFGTGGHNAWSVRTYPISGEEAVFKLLDQNNLRSYRVDVQNDTSGYNTLDRLLVLGKKYNITIRPMLYVDSGSSNDAYQIAKRYAADIHIWELGNELNLRGEANFIGNINLMIQARRGIMKAASETGQDLKTAINVTAGLGGNVALNAAYTTYPFLDQAISMGLQFDYITYHYYPNIYDLSGGWMHLYLEPLRKYGKPVFLNEFNCAQIYEGDDGNSAVCAQTVENLITYVQANYQDMVQEMVMYELMDDTFISGPEGHFGLMYDIGHPKSTFAVLSQHALANASCGAILNGGTTWTDDAPGSSTVAVTDKRCSYGATATTTWVNQKLQTCAHGVFTYTGTTRRTNTLTQHDVCNPPPASCGSIASDTNGWINQLPGSSTAVATTKQCPYGGSITTTWLNQIVEHCSNGVLTATSRTRQANIVTRASCNPKPASCGVLASGKNAWADVNQGSATSPASSKQCRHGGTVTTTWTNQVVQRCTNGVLSNTSRLRKTDIVTHVHCN